MGGLNTSRKLTKKRKEISDKDKHIVFMKSGGCWASISIRPERHLTKDGSVLLAPDKIGRKVTKLKAKMYNDKYMGEIVFSRLVGDILREVKDGNDAEPKYKYYM